MTRIPDPRWLCALLAAGALSGCAQLETLLETKPQREQRIALKREAERDHSRAVQRDAEKSEARSEARAESQPGREQAALREGIRLYNEGDFNGAIRRLGSNDIRSNSPLKTRVTALKYTAFSYCVTSRPKQCEQAFERALKLDPDFTLEPGEQGHPLWGPVFERAKADR